MATQSKKTEKNDLLSVPRPPIVCVMGHVDHGKSTLLEFVRKTKITDFEAGGITQKIGAYEIEHKSENGQSKAITFLDTPGHEAFKAIRERGASVADIAVLVVSAEDGVKPQTLDAYRAIKTAGIPFLVAINKIDKPGADVERTKQSLAENEIYLEGYGGDIPFSAISAKTGEGVDEMLEVIDLIAELHGLIGNPALPAEGFIIESHLDKRRGPSGSIVIKNGTLKKGDFIVAGNSFAPLRIIEDDRGKNVSTAGMGQPVAVVGWNQIPEAGAPFKTVPTKKEAEALVQAYLNTVTQPTSHVINNSGPEEGSIVIPVIIKADAAGTLDAIAHEFKKVATDRAKLRIVTEGIGDVSENDAKKAESVPGTVIISFNVLVDSRAKAIAERSSIVVMQFDVIYKLTEWLSAFLVEKTPRIKVEEPSGSIKILKIFSKEKDRQVVGGKVLEGMVHSGDDVIIKRREAEIGRGKIRELQKQRTRVDEVQAGLEFGCLVESKITLAEGDILTPFKVVEK